MRQDLTSHPIYEDLTRGGVPPQVAIRAAWLLGGREPIFLDARKTEVDEGIREHEVVVMTVHRIIYVRAHETLAATSKRVEVTQASVCNRARLTEVHAEGDDSAWDDLIIGRDPLSTDGPGPIRRYRLTFADNLADVTIPLTRNKQEEADMVASCLAYEVQ